MAKATLRKLAKIKAVSSGFTKVGLRKQKLHSKSAATKRFTLKSGGKIKSTQANKRHMMRKQSKRQLNNQTGMTIMHKSDELRVKKFCNLHLAS